jgi:hypothetical protein
MALATISWRPIVTINAELEDLRTRLRGSLAREDDKGLILVPATYVREALAALPSTGAATAEAPKESPLKGFAWTAEMYAAWNQIGAIKGKRLPFMGELEACWRALNKAAFFE